MPTSPRPFRSLRPAAAAISLAALLSGCAGTEAGEAAAVVSTEPTAPTGPPAGGTAPGAAPTPAATKDDALVLTVGFAAGTVSGVDPRTPVPLGGRVRLTITSDTPDEAHLHGYDLTEQLAPGQPVTMEFVADRPGVFELELHDSHTVLTRLQVQ